MTVQLGGIDLNNSLRLEGVEESPPINYSVRELLGGNSVIQTDERTAGALLRLTAIGGSVRVGKFCEQQLDSIRTIAAVGNQVSLVHPRKSCQVFILGIENVQEAEPREPFGPTKEYSASIILQEV